MLKPHPIKSFNFIEIDQALANPSEEIEAPDNGQQPTPVSTAVSTNKVDKEPKKEEEEEAPPSVAVKHEIIDITSPIKVKQEVIDISSDSEGEKTDNNQLVINDNQKTVEDDPLAENVVLTQQDPIQKIGMYDLF